LDGRSRASSSGQGHCVQQTSSEISSLPTRMVRTGIVIKLVDAPEMPSLKEAVAKETTDLLDRCQRLSVRELTMKFEKGFNTATLLSNEVWRLHV